MSLLVCGEVFFGSPALLKRRMFRRISSDVAICGLS